MVDEITANMAAITCSMEAHLIRIRCYCFASPTDEDRERLSFMAAEVIADFADPYSVNEEIVALNGRQPDCLSFWAFKRGDLDLNSRPQGKSVPDPM